MKLRIFSDIHQELRDIKGLDPWSPHPLPTDKETTLILAGDLAYQNEIAAFLTRLGRQFKYVVAVLGNHDYWLCHDWKHHPQVVKNTLEFDSIDNVFLLENEDIVLDGVRFVGATFWTDMDRGNPLSKLDALSTMMADFSRINLNNHGNPFTPDAWIKTHKDSFRYIQKTVESSLEPVVVVTHHGPSYQFARPQYPNGQEFFFSSYDMWIGDQENLKLWAFGHSHNVDKKRVGNCDLVINAIGYPGDLWVPAPMFQEECYEL